MDDLISRKAAIDSIRECAEAAHSNQEWDMEQGYLNAIECIEEEPSAEPKHGKWLMNSGRPCECSVCHHQGNEYGYDRYCWNCGSRMDG